MNQVFKHDLKRLQQVYVWQQDRPRSLDHPTMTESIGIVLFFFVTASPEDGKTATAWLWLLLLLLLLRFVVGVILFGVIEIGLLCVCCHL